MLGLMAHGGKFRLDSLEMRRHQGLKKKNDEIWFTYLKFSAYYGRNDLARPEGSKQTS